MKSREQKALDWVNENEIDREQKKLENCLAFCFFLLMFCIAITGCGTYWNFGEAEIPTKAETVSCEEISVSETTVADEDIIVQMGGERE